MDPKIINFWTTFGTIWRPFWGQNWLQQGTKNGTTFGPPPALRCPGVAILGIKREWWNCYSYWNYILQKKKRDFHAKLACVVRIGLVFVNLCGVAVYGFTHVLRPFYSCDRFRNFRMTS